MKIRIQEVRAKFEFKLEDMWVGVFWRHDIEPKPNCRPAAIWERLDVWVCLIPCCPLHLIIRMEPEPIPPVEIPYGND